VTGPIESLATPLFLYDPPSPGAQWAPFAGVRPLCELRAGIWRIRERWEGLLQSQTAGIIADHVAGWHEFDEPEVTAIGPISGPAVVGASWFAPAGVPPELPDGTRRLTNDGVSVGWLVAAGEEWAGPHDDGPGVEIEGLLLEGSWDLLTALEGFLQADCADFHDQPRDDIAEGSIVLGDPVEIISLGALIEPGVVFDVRHGAIILEEGVEVRSGTRLGDALGSGSVPVNSMHHQGIRDLGARLVATAIAPDGLIEAAEVEGAGFAVGVQWHPEMFTSGEPGVGTLFESFVEAARR
jgi:hypothetical protein